MYLLAGKSVLNSKVTVVGAENRGFEEPRRKQTYDTRQCQHKYAVLEAIVEPHCKTILLSLYYLTHIDIYCDSVLMETNKQWRKLY